MLGKEDASDDNDPDSGNRQKYWRSASWSSSRMSLPPLVPDSDKDSLDGNGCSRRVVPLLTPRSNSSKGRSLLPPLSIARRSLDEWPKAGSDDVGEWNVPSTPSGDRLKLDLSTIQRVPDKNATLGKREKIALFDKKCSKVGDHVFLGGDAVAKDKIILKQHGITHVLNCVGFVCPEYFKENFVYRTLWLQDSPSEDITSILYDVFDYFEDVREQNGKVYVHCCQGVSRSTSLVIAYRMWREGQSFDDAFQYVKKARGIADPNMGFACQLLQCQKRVHAFPLSPSSLLRLYRIAPHSPYDPLHLVPKMLNSPSPVGLDSRGAFIVHLPSTIYLWVGQKCESIMERDARGAVCQIVRYEKVQGPILVVKEGEEPSYFWDAFSTFIPLMNVFESSKASPGNRIIDSYNVDFEIFQKAITGGFVPPCASSETEQEMHLPARENTWSVLRRKFVSGNMKEFVLASKLSNLSLVSTKLSPHSISKSSEFIDVNFTSNKRAESIFSPSKRSLSIAERRGGTPPCLKSPVMSKDFQTRDYGKLETSDTQKVPNQELMPLDVSFSKGSDVQNDLGQTSVESKGTITEKSVNQTVVAHEWPSLVKVPRVDYRDLGSRQMFIFTAPSSDSGKLGECDLYLWVGKDFRHLGDSKNPPGRSEGCDDPSDFDMKEVVKDVRAQMGLSEDTRIKVVKQDKESSEFLALLSSL
ncbi:dual specificity phosphatase, catalytic domain-containing protein [Artemisia annua]|uniref:Dual specificity phosphatase, catalytic domain-containing protein n=1 Tax=Artemisia annua TaxID=35608 RepID=A0A2U1PEM6_ARTAN|nr:dual specificity phosphatase, catalytic domain-containing protein [Artemisia annua]